LKQVFWLKSNKINSQLFKGIEMAQLNELANAIIEGDQDAAVQITKAAIDEGMVAKNILDEGLIAGMNIVGARFKKNEMYIPEVLMAARAMKTALQSLEPELAKAKVEPVGTFLIGTVKGDLHDIGKNLVAMMLSGAGFDVTDLGVDVTSEQFIAKAQQTSAQLIGLSALLTTTMPAMEATIKALRQAGVSVKVLVGGAPITQNYADKIGADGYAADAASAVDIAKALIG